MWHLYEPGVCIPNFCGVMRVFALPENWVILGDINAALRGGGLNCVKIFCTYTCKNAYLLSQEFISDRPC